MNVRLAWPGVLGLLFAMTIAPAVQPATDDIAQQELGTIGNPVRALGTQGGLEYIESLDCNNGAIPEYRRDDTASLGPYGNRLEKYTLRCQADTVLIVDIFIDPSHDETTTIPVKGFTSWL